MNNDTDDMQDEHPRAPIESGVRSKYTRRSHAGTNVIPIDPGLCRHFPDSGAVNRALRQHLESQRSAT